MLPGFVYYLVLRYGPMFGLVIAFQDYNYYAGLIGSKFVGLKYFLMFMRSPGFARVFFNTIILGFCNVIFVLPVAVLFALLLNEIRFASLKNTTQSIALLPFFISNVVLIGIAIRMLSPSTGVINGIIAALGGEPIYFLIKPEWFRPIYVLSEIYQRNGWFAVVFTAAILQIEPDLYEQAEIDGAGRLRKIASITVPLIIPVVLIMTILQIGRVVSLSFEKALLLQNPVTYETSDILDTFIYRRGLLNGELSYGAAVGLFQGLVGCLFLFVSNYLSRLATNRSIW
jgi:putative aldouronate transport system permease protein